MERRDRNGDRRKVRKESKRKSWEIRKEGEDCCSLNRRRNGEKEEKWRQRRKVRKERKRWEIRKKGDEEVKRKIRS